jgi:hypothetical protein
MFGKLILLAILVVGGLYLCSRTADAAPLALADPDVIHIHAWNVYRDVAQTGDELHLVQYHLEYAVLPDESVTQGWLVRLLDTGAGQLASVAPFSGGSIPDLGYSEGLVSIYFEEQPTLVGGYQIRLEGNPSLSPSSTGISSLDFTLRDASQLADDVRGFALFFEEVWAVDLLSIQFDNTLRFTAAGEEYFSAAVPGARLLFPDLYSLQSVNLEVPDRDADSQTYEDQLANQWQSVPIIKAMFDTFPGITGLPGAQGIAVGKTILALGFCTLISFAVVASTNLRQEEWWPSAAMAVFVVTGLGLASVGLMPFAVLAGLLIVMAVVMVVQFFVFRTA